MSSAAQDPHLLCIACRGIDCDSDRKCIQCRGWSGVILSTFLSCRRKVKRQERYRAKRKGSRVSVAPSVKPSGGRIINVHDISVESVSAVVGPEDSASQVPSVRSLSSKSLMSKVRREVVEPFASKIEAQLACMMELIKDSNKADKPAVDNNDNYNLPVYSPPASSTPQVSPENVIQREPVPEAVVHVAPQPVVGQDPQ